MTPYYKKITINHVRGFQHNIKNEVYKPLGGLQLKYFVTDEPVKYCDIDKNTFKDIAVGDKWGKLWDCAWFKVTGEVPDYPISELVLMLDFAGEACVFDEYGTPVRGLTNINSEFDRSLGDPGKRYVPLAEVSSGKTVDFYVEAGCNDLFGKYCGGIVVSACFALVNHELRNLYYDYNMLLMLAESLDENSVQRAKIIYSLGDVQAALSSDFTTDEVKKAREILAKELNRTNAPDPLLSYYAIGHAHMDLAWLWPIRETRRKIGRTFSCVIANMQNDKDYMFGASQPQQLEWLKQDYPALFEKVRQKVKDGRIEAQGAMWVEADTNVSGGEALVRQIMYGKKFFKEEFGRTPTLVWLPDVFGFSGALPQIMKKSGIDNFVTIKLSWSEFNHFPHNTFWWAGIDGSKVLVHLPPELTYNSGASPQSLKIANDNYVEKGIVDKAMMLYGIGDGGGGPNHAHLERLKRMKNLLGVPPVKQAGAEQFFADLRADLPNGLKTHSGEMYLERHQGTYTTQANNKKYNRILENKLRRAELLCVSANKMRGAEYPTQKLETIWKEVLLYQFHDILPGSSIKRVYDESFVEYLRLEKQADEIADSAINSFACSQKNAYNSTSFTGQEYVKDGDEWYQTNAIALGTSTLTKAEGTVQQNGLCIKNDFVSVEFCKDGTIKSLVDNGGCERLNYGLKLNIYNDFGDAWDMNIAYEESLNCTLMAESIIQYNNKIEVGFKIAYKYGKSQIEVIASLKPLSQYLQLDFNIDWRENGKMLRMDYDFTAISDEVTCDIQYGNIKRRTTKSNSLEFAQFEICAHKWLDYSDLNGGVSLINNSKYGYRAEGSRISANLLRSTSYPAEHADIGNHKFAYALYPHNGKVESCNVNALGYLFNNPLTVVSAQIDSLITLNDESIIVDCVKQSEDGKSMVVRMYECVGVKKTCCVLAPKFSKWCLSDMTEKEGKLIETANGIDLSFDPFEIMTIILK